MSAKIKKKFVNFSTKVKCIKICAIIVVAIISSSPAWGELAYTIFHDYNSIPKSEFQADFKPNPSIEIPPSPFMQAKPYIEKISELITQAEEKHFSLDYYGAIEKYNEVRIIYEKDIPLELKEEVKYLTTLYFNSIKGQGYNQELVRDRSGSYMTYKKGLEIDSSDYVVLVGMGNSLFYLNRDQAEIWYLRAEASDKSKINAKLGLLKFAIWKNELDTIDKKIEEILDIANDLSNVDREREIEIQMVRIMYSFEEMQKKTEVEEWAEKILMKYPDNEDAKKILHSEGMIMLNNS